MPALDRNVKVTWENCGTSATKYHLSRHKSRCSGGTLYCTQCPNFSTKSRDYLFILFIYLSHCQTTQCSRSFENIQVYFVSRRISWIYALRQHKNTQHGTQIGFGASSIDVEDILGDIDDQSLREEVQSCRHFLVDAEIQKGKHSVFNFAVNSLTAQVIEEKLDRVMVKLKCVAKPNLALSFILKNIEDGKFRYFYAHESNT